MSVPTLNVIRRPVRCLLTSLILLVVVSTGALLAADGSPRPGPSLIGQSVPEFDVKAVDGRPMSTKRARDRFLLVAFSDAKSQVAGKAFFRDHAADFATVDRLVFYNVIVPGGVLLAPKGVIVNRVKSDAARLEKDVRASLSPGQLKKYDQTEILWHVDFDRRTTALFGVPPHQVSLALIDPTGQVVAVESPVDVGAIRRILARIKGRGGLPR